MPLFRPPKLAILTGVVLAALVVLIGAAQAATASQSRTAAVRPDTTGDYIHLYSADSPNEAQGELAVTLNSSSPVASVIVHVYDSTGTTDLLDPAVTQTTANTGAVPGGYQSVWTVAAPITQAQLPVGQYLVEVNAADTGGTTVTGLNQAWNFTAAPHVTISADSTAISLASPTATVSGQVTLVAPDGTVTPYSGSSITVREEWGAGIQTVSTDATGDYSFTVSPTAEYSTAPKLSITVSDAATGRTSNTALLQFAVTVAPSKLTAALSAANVTYGSAVSLTGTASYQPAGSSAYQPLAGTTVGLYSTASPAYAIQTTTTDASGGFTFHLPRSLAVTWTVKIGMAQSNTSLVAAATVSLPMQVSIGTVIKNFKVSLDQYWGLRYSGCADFTMAISNLPFPAKATVKIQWAKTAAGPWYTLASAHPAGPACGSSNGMQFSGTTTAKWSAAYYRAYLPAIPATSGGVGYHAATSASAYAWKYDDRITGFSVSPTTVNSNGRITVKGTLQYLNNGWRGYAGQVIYIIFHDTRFCGSSTGWCYMVKAKTNSRGQFSATFADFIDTAPWAALFEGNSTHFAADTNSITVKVR